MDRGKNQGIHNILQRINFNHWRFEEDFLKILSALQAIYNNSTIAPADGWKLQTWFYLAKQQKCNTQRQDVKRI